MQTFITDNKCIVFVSRTLVFNTNTWISSYIHCRTIDCAFALAEWFGFFIFTYLAQINLMTRQGTVITGLNRMQWADFSVNLFISPCHYHEMFHFIDYGWMQLKQCINNASLEWPNQSNMLNMLLILIRQILILRYLFRLIVGNYDWTPQNWPTFQIALIRPSDVIYFGDTDTMHASKNN